MSVSIMKTCKKCGKERNSANFIKQLCYHCTQIGSDRPQVRARRSERMCIVCRELKKPHLYATHNSRMCAECKESGAKHPPQVRGEYLEGFSGLMADWLRRMWK